MRLHERLGRAVRVGTAPGRRHQRSVIWQITEDGAAWLADRSLGRLREASSLDEAEARAHEVQVAIARMVDFYREGGLPVAPKHHEVGRRTRPPTNAAPGQDWWTPRGLAAELHMSLSAVYKWIHRGRVIAKCDPFWKINANAAELERLRELLAGPPGYSGQTRRG
jgi:hypothetical protein